MAATDNFSTFTNPLFGPVTKGEAVTPSDSTELTNVSRALFVGGSGNLALVLASGDEVTLTGVTAGSWLWIRVKQVKSTGTTATNIAALS